MAFLDIRSSVRISAQHIPQPVHQAEASFACFIADADWQAHEVPHVRHAVAVQRRSAALLHALHDDVG